MSFRIDIERDADAGADDPHRIAIRAGEHTFTRLLRAKQNDPDDFLEVPPAQLAFWFIDNWWRLRWESVPPGGITSDWRLAHDLSSIGGGYAWPRVTIWGEGERLGLSGRSDPQGVVGPVRFLNDILTFVQADLWEKAVDQFLVSAANEKLGFGSDRAALRAQLNSLKSERADKEVATWRRLEARLGFDPDKAPDDLMKALAKLIEHHGTTDVEEAVQAAPGPNSAEILLDELKAARASRLVCEFNDAVKAVGPVKWRSNLPPWVPAEAAAQRLRKALDINSGPLRNRRLAEVLGVSCNALGSAISTPAAKLPYSLRIADSRQPDCNVVALRPRYAHDRRFELARALGDAIWSRDASMGPIARTKTDRQRFQRAFAQSLLCPFEDLQAFFGRGEISDEMIMAAAHHFHVNKSVVETTLVKKKLLPVERFDDMIEAA